MKFLKANTMKMTNYFNFSRLGLLLKMELFRSRKGIVMTFVITFGLLFFAGLLLTSIFDGNKLVHEHNGGFAFSLILGGFIMSSLAYNDLTNTLKQYHYLTLPASVFEKFMSMWLLTSVGWIAIFTIIYTAYTWFANATGQLLFSHITFLTFDPFGEASVNAMKYYFVLQGLFLAGAVHFKGYVLPKTLFTLVALGLVCSAIAYFMLNDLFYFDDESIFTPDLLKDMQVYQIWLVMRWLFWWTLAPLCWVIAYLGLKEREV
jgi:hypothetical protein